MNLEETCDESTFDGWLFEVVESWIQILNLPI